MNQNLAYNGDLVAEESEEDDVAGEEDPQILQIRLEAQIDADRKEVERQKRRAEVEAGLLVISAEFEEEFWPYLVDQLIEPPHMLKLLSEHSRMLKMKHVNDPKLAARKISIMSHLKFIGEARGAAKQTYRNLTLGACYLRRFKYVFAVADRSILKFQKKFILYREEVLDMQPMPNFRFYSGVIVKQGEHIELEIASIEDDPSLFPGDKVTLIFPPPPFMFEAQQDVVKCLVNDEEVSKKIFPPSGLASNSERNVVPNLNNLNAAQSSVVHGVINNDPQFANIVLGPPGTGKTETLAETINQIVKKDQKVHVLVVAHSNAAVDSVTMALLDRPELPNYVMRRVYAQSRPKRFVPSEILGADITFQDKPKGFYIPTNKATFAGHQITLCTINAASRLKFLGKKFYSYVFVDEAAQCLEMDSCIPLALFAGPTTKFSLFGDPNQLRPFFRDSILSQRNYDTVTPTMDRLRKQARQNQIPNRFYLLNVNYRSDARLVQPFSDLFYQSKVESQFVPNEASGRAKAFVGTLGNNAARFHVCYGKEEEVYLKEKLTFLNLQEIRLVEYYMEVLTKSGIEERNIGIVSPYRGQLAAMMERIGKKYPNTWMASVDRFQGNERSIIILTTVKTKRIGFLDDYRRLNVAISRPRDALIIIGSLELLSGDHYWNAYGRMLLHAGAIYDTERMDDGTRELGFDGKRYWTSKLYPVEELNIANRGFENV